MEVKSSLSGALAPVHLYASTHYDSTPSLLVANSEFPTQTFASVISLLNEALMAEGYPPLRFLNPWLHSGGYKGLNDIVGGNNPGCGIPGSDAVKGGTLSLVWEPPTWAAQRSPFGWYEEGRW